jgi:flagellar hook assembly protein FlgD
VFDVSGRVIRTLVDEAKTAGSFSVIWDGKNDGGERVASGVFFYQLNAPGSELNKKIVILQ